jgi:hypothetical protein
MFKETEIGFELLTNDYLVFFGKHPSQLKSLHQQYPYLDWAQLKQVHGNQIVQTSKAEMELQTADAHWTSVSQLGLITKTADCIPILGFNHLSKAIVSIHAGWRGVANQITSLSIQKLSQSHPVAGWKLFVGPHIQQQSFEIQQDTVDQLKECSSLASSEWLISTPTGFKANLSLILLQQLQDCGINKNQIHTLFFDTKSDLRFHSFRRDKELSGRQLSFIAKIK